MHDNAGIHRRQNPVCGRSPMNSPKYLYLERCPRDHEKVLQKYAVILMKRDNHENGSIGYLDSQYHRLGNSISRCPDDVSKPSIHGVLLAVYFHRPTPTPYPKLGEEKYVFLVQLTATSYLTSSCMMKTMVKLVARRLMQLYSQATPTTGSPIKAK